jgi:lipoyl(octanoyl) transferase
MKLGRLRLIREGNPRPAAINMAVDEALFLTAEYPVLRSYGWARPSVSFGYFTPWKEVVRRYPGRELVRRWTGGGIVEHGQDFTYSLVYPRDEHLPSTIEFYQFVHLAVAEILRTSGFPIEIVRLTDPVPSPACFEKAVQFDLKLQGEKIAGAAIRRNRRGLLFQGSIQRLKVPVQFDLMLAGALGEQVESYDPSDMSMERAKRIAKEKYGAAEWNRRR